MRASISFFFTLFFALLNVPGCEVESLVWTLLELFCDLAGNIWKLYEDNFWIFLRGCFLVWQAMKDDGPLLKLWCWNPCLNLGRNLCWNPGMNLALQSFKVARWRGKVPGLQQDPKDAGLQGSRLKGSKFKVSGFQGFQHLSLQVFQGFMVPGFSDTWSNPAH